MSRARPSRLARCARTGARGLHGRRRERGTERNRTCTGTRLRHAHALERQQAQPITTPCADASRRLSPHAPQAGGQACRRAASGRARSEVDSQLYRRDARMGEQAEQRLAHASLHHRGRRGVGHRPTCRGAVHFGILRVQPEELHLTPSDGEDCGGASGRKARRLLLHRAPVQRHDHNFSCHLRVLVIIRARLASARRFATQRLSPKR